MHLNLCWKIIIGSYQLAMLESVEIHKSVDLLADTCTIKIPASVYNNALKVEDKIKVGDVVTVALDYNKKDGEELQNEFTGHLQRIDTDNGDLTLMCEDDLFLLRKPVKDKEFKKAGLKTIAQYVVDETKSGLKLNVTLTIDYDKFVISKATGYDVLKKIQEETNGNIYIKDGTLHIHPLYIEKHGDVTYSFQHNIESADLKYRNKDDRKIEVIIENTDAKGKKVEARAGVTGGDKVTLKGHGMSKEAMQKKAENEYNARSYDGYEGSITTWLWPFVEPGYSAKIKDEDYTYKDGTYYVISVTTTMSSSGGVRKVQLGRRLA